MCLIKMVYVFTELCDSYIKLVIRALYPIRTEILYSRPIRYKTKSNDFFIWLSDFPAPGTCYKFLAIGASYMFSHPWRQLYFSRTWRQLHIFPHLVPVTCFPAFGAGYTFLYLTNYFIFIFYHRIIVPLFKMLDMLFSNGCFELFTQDERYISQD